MPYDSSVQAEYQDGFILDETEQNDVSLFSDGHNTFYDILNGLPEEEHGPMVRFTVFWKNQRYDLDWTVLPKDARPIRFRHGYHHWHSDGTEEQGWSGIGFGYQYTDNNGKNIKDVKELT